MGVRDLEECETLEIRLPRNEVDSTQLIDSNPSVDRSNGQQRIPSPTSNSSEKLSFLNKPNPTTSLNCPTSIFPPTKKPIYIPRKTSTATSMRNASASFSFSYPIIIVFLITIILLGVTLDSFLHHQRDTIGCEVPRMNPSYIKQIGFDSEQTRFAGKYGLHLYRDLSYDHSDQPTGIPALFIPGNAGSYKQVRSIAAETSKLYYYKNLSNKAGLMNKGLRPIDFFTVDFNEELSAFHGHSLLEQAEYLNDAIRYILSLYPAVRKNQQTNSSVQPHPDPTAVIIIGHSMGGVVARTLFTMSNYQSGSINTILTMSSPHLMPPAPFDWQISKIYTDINDFWRNGYSQSATSQNSLVDVTLISIAGGNLDTVVCSDSANINSLVPASHGFTVFTTSIPNVWTAMDHQCILWCNQLVKVVANSLLSVVDIRRASQTRPSSERMSVFRKILLSGLEEPVVENESDKLRREPFGIINLEKVSHKFLDMGQRLVLNNSELISKVYLMPIPPPAPHSTLNTFSFLMGQSFSKNSELDILLCYVMPTEVPTHYSKDDFSVNDLSLPINPRLSCHVASNETSLVPASTFDVKHPFSGETFNYLKLKVKELGDYQYIAVMFHNDFVMKGFLVGEFYDESSSLMDINTSMKDLLIDGIHIDSFPEQNSLVSILRIPVIYSSLLTYKMAVHRIGCTGNQLFAPFLRQSISSMFESKFLINIEKADLNIHGQAPFITPVSAPNLQRGLELKFWIDPTCSAPLSIDIELDLYGSLGKIVMRFQTVLVAFPYIIVIMTLRAQLREYNRGEPFLSFSQGLALFVRQTFPKFLIAVTILSVYQSVTGASKTYSLTDLFPMDYTSGDMQKVIKAKASFNVNDTLLGNQDPFFWFLPPVFFVMSIGIVTFCWVLLGCIVKIFAGATVFMSRQGKFSTHLVNRLRRRGIATIILFISVATFVPYQFAFVVAFFVHIVSCVRSLIIARIGYRSSNIQENWDHCHYLQSILLVLFMLLPFNLPVLMVWIRNMSVHWFAPFSSDHNILAIAPIQFPICDQYFVTSDNYLCVIVWSATFESLCY
ncbi:4166_t:CDS:10 [Diversispora eburnea]|uniref:GPI inositol-deacylase n=1 Tax=Diversispora eburnea TaxID=1213867 RepID=A0A9N8V045_9GLOM|nr:4166_t:CDS:10 [Diversispora eburnea]